jgi:benzoyl-CoA 2,3-dioxygenase component B
VGVFAGLHVTPAGQVVSKEEWDVQAGQWLPTDTDKTHVRSLMQPVYERGKIASWIAPPRNGINGKPFDYDYVHVV